MIQPPPPPPPPSLPPSPPSSVITSKVKVLYKFSQMGHMDHPQSNDRLNKLLTEVLLVGPEELPLLQYWRSALNKDYKTHLIKTERSQ